MVPNETDQKRILNYLEKPYTSHPEYFIRTYYFYRLTLQHPKYKKYMMQNNFSLLPASDIAKCLLVLFAKKQNYQNNLFFSKNKQLKIFCNKIIQPNK